MNENRSSAVPDNKFTFECPTVKRDARFVVCNYKITKHMKGENFQDQDCRCALRASKCPALRMRHKEYRTDERLYFSTSSDVKKCPADIAEDMANVVIMPFHGAGLNLTDANKMTLFGSLVEIREVSQSVHTDTATESMEPKVTRKPRSDRRVARGVRGDLEEGFATAAVDNTAAIINAVNGGGE